MTQPSPDAQAVRPTTRRLAATGASVLALLVLVGAIWWLVGRRDDDGSEGAPGTSSPSASTTNTSDRPSPPADLGPRPILRSSAPSGSGCSPGTEALPDGWWFGWLESSIGSGPSFDLDLACFFDGRLPDDGDAIQNDSAQVRSIPSRPDIELVCIDVEGAEGITEVPCPPGRPDRTLPVWVRMEGGTATKVLEQFIP